MKLLSLPFRANSCAHFLCIAVVVGACSDSSSNSTPGGSGNSSDHSGSGNGQTNGSGNGSSTGSGNGSGSSNGSNGSGGGNNSSGGTGGNNGTVSDGGTVVKPAGDGGPVMDYGCLLVPSATGWIDKASNDAKIQGAVYTYVDTGGSTIAPLTDSTHWFTNNGAGKLCVKGTAAKVVDMNYTKYFGAAMGIDLCHAASTDPMPNMKWSIGNCPNGLKLTGLKFNVTGGAIPTDLRATFNEPGRAVSTYVVVSQGANVVKFADGKVIYDTTQPPVNVSQIDSVHFTIVTNEDAPVPFDFCVEHVEPLTTGGTCDNGYQGAPDGGSMNGGTGSGVLPTNITASTDIATPYAAWKTSYVQSCGGNGSFVKSPQDNNTGYSEGIGYGMLLAVANGDQTTFDALWQFYTAHTDGNGLMNWHIGADCGGAIGSGSATDGDLDSAMALVQASCKWGGSYAQKASDLIGKIKSKEITSSGGTQVVKPGDSFNDATCINPSYFAPGYFRAFGRHTNDESFWNKVADDSYGLINKLANGTTGLVPNWGHTDGSAPHGECARSEATIFSYDAARTPWRIATDYRWWQTAAAQPLLNKYVAFAKSKGIDSVGDKYNLDGSVVSSFHTPVTTGSFAAATLVSDAATANQFYQSLKGIQVTEYYPTTLKLLYLAFGAGLFDRCVK